jgi:hypothetical protein
VTRAHNRRVLALIGDVHDRCTLAQAYPQCRLFMVDCLSMVHHLLPPPAQDALAVAEKFCNGTASARQLVAQQTLCWEYLRARGLSVAFERRDARLVRATLCALYPLPPEDRDVYELLEWFVDMFDSAGRFEDRTIELLNLRFAMAPAAVIRANASSDSPTPSG